MLRPHLARDAIEHPLHAEERVFSRTRHCGVNSDVAIIWVLTIHSPFVFKMIMLLTPFLIEFSGSIGESFKVWIQRSGCGLAQLRCYWPSKLFSAFSSFCHYPESTDQLSHHYQKIMYGTVYCLGATCTFTNRSSKLVSWPVTLGYARLLDAELV